MLDVVGIHCERLAELERLLDDIVNNPTFLNDENFDVRLDVQKMVEELFKDAVTATSSGGNKTFTFTYFQLIFLKF